MALTITGLEELRTALRNLPTELRDEAAGIVTSTVDRVAAELHTAYPDGGTGNLRRGIKKTIDKSAFGVRGTVTSTSRHAHLWEFGTQNRRTRQGWNRGRGPSHIRQGLISISLRERRKMEQGLIELVRRAGFEVSVT